MSHNVQLHEGPWESQGVTDIRSLNERFGSKSRREFLDGYYGPNNWRFDTTIHDEKNDSARREAAAANRLALSGSHNAIAGRGYVDNQGQSLRGHHHQTTSDMGHILVSPDGPVYAAQQAAE